MDYLHDMIEFLRAEDTLSIQSQDVIPMRAVQRNGTQRHAVHVLQPDVAAASPILHDGDDEDDGGIVPAQTGSFVDSDANDESSGPTQAQAAAALQPRSNRSRSVASRPSKFPILSNLSILAKQ
jgi:hypothetical protein